MDNLQITNQLYIGLFFIDVTERISIVLKITILINYFIYTISVCYITVNFLIYDMSIRCHSENGMF